MSSKIGNYTYKEMIILSKSTSGNCDVILSENCPCWPFSQAAGNYDFWINFIRSIIRHVMLGLDHPSQHHTDFYLSIGYFTDSILQSKLCLELFTHRRTRLWLLSSMWTRASWRMSLSLSLGVQVWEEKSRWVHMRLNFCSLEFANTVMKIDSHLVCWYHDKNRLHCWWNGCLCT